MTDQTLWNDYIQALKSEVKPALGCTEPISLAFACATAAKHAGNEEVVNIKAYVSPNLFKNGLGVTVPGTGMQGLEIAAAAGWVCGDANADLEVLKNINASAVETAKGLLDKRIVTVEIADTEKALYTEAVVKTNQSTIRVVIEDAHTALVSIEKNGEMIFKADANSNSAKKSYDLSKATVADIVNFSATAPLADIEFMLAAGTINNALAIEGLQNDYGLKIGRTFVKQVEKGFLANDLLTEIMTRTTAASDARMGGATLPAMSNSGSGNQGIAATMPVVVVADFAKSSEEERTRALTLSHLMAIYIHSVFPSLSALCAAATAAMGAAAGMAWILSKHSALVVDDTICNMIGDLAGMVCDGAANSCAMKVSSSASSAFKAMTLALDGIKVTGKEGLVSSTADESIQNLGQLVSTGMKQTDYVILKIMQNK